MLRDIDILARMAGRNLVTVALSVTTLDPRLARTDGAARARAAPAAGGARQLRGGVPATGMVAPMIPAVNDDEMEGSSKPRQAAARAGYVLLRLPLEVRDLFREWLARIIPTATPRVQADPRHARRQDYDSSGAAG